MKSTVTALIDAIKECNSHFKNLNHAIQRLEGLLPFTADNYSRMTDDEAGHLDQFLLRFAKLQDCMGKKLFKAILINIGEYQPDEPFIDQLNKLEKFGAIRFKPVGIGGAMNNEWQFIRHLRNQLSHDYPESINERVETTNKYMAHTVRLFDIYNDSMNYANRKILSKTKALILETPEFTVKTILNLNEKFYTGDGEGNQISPGTIDRLERR